VVVYLRSVGVADVALAMGEWEGDHPKVGSHSQEKVGEQRWRDEEQNLGKVSSESPWVHRMHRMKEGEMVEEKRAA
jgi:hypothetical protein